MSKIYDVIIIGAGPAGLAAALYAGRARLSTLVIEKIKDGGQIVITDEIENYPGAVEGESGPSLIAKMVAQANHFGAEKVFDTVQDVELEGDVKVIKGAKAEYQGKTVIIATGASPKPIGCPGEKELTGKGVSYCATCDGMFYRGKTVAVVGGGDTAAADALYLSRLCEKVYLIHRRDTLRASRSYLPLLEQAGNVEFLWNTQVEELLCEGALSGVRLKNGLSNETRELSCAGVFVAVGSVPATELVRGQVELDPAGYVPADETTRTSLPGVYAIGDLRKKPLRQVVTAVADGAVAAHFIEEYLNG